MNEIIIALISGVCVAVPTIIATVVANNKSQAVLEYRIKELDEKVHAHNNLIDRMYKVENRVTLLEEREKEK